MARVDDPPAPTLRDRDRTARTGSRPVAPAGPPALEPPDAPTRRPLLRSRRLLAILLVALVAFTAAGSVAMIGREAIWTRMFGDPDLGPYDFDRPTRTGKMNDALACPDAACTDARPTLATPVFAAPAADLIAALRETLTAAPTTTVVEDDPAAGRLRAVVRTPVFRFPDTLSAEVRPIGPDRSALYLYSRSQIGHADLGANAERIRRLLADLAARFPGTE